MPITIEKIPGASILVIHSERAFGNIAIETAVTIAQISRVLDEQTGKVFLVHDLSKLALTLDDIMEAARQAASGSKPLLHHPNIRENIFVLTDPLVRMAIKGLDCATFGQIKAPVFNTIEEALEYCRESAEVGARPR